MNHIELYHLDQRINDRGFQIDVDFARKALALVKRAQRQLGADVQELTDGDVESARKREQMLGYLLVEHGLTLENLRASTLEKVLASQTLSDDAAELLRIRLAATTSSTAKFQRVLDWASADGRLRGGSVFRGAGRTGRTAGRGFQPLNLPRVSKRLKPHVDPFIAAVKAGAWDADPKRTMEMASASLRGLIVAPPGKTMPVADSSNIEGRLTAWVTGERWKLDAFREYDAGTGPDLYNLTYSRTFGVPLALVDDDMRQIGKVMELAFGFGGAVGAWNTMAAGYGIELPEPDIVANVKAWRAAHPKNTEFRYGIEDAVRRAIRTPDQTFEFGPLRIRTGGAWLRIVLPSGRALCYPHPRVGEDDTISYMGVHQWTHQWVRIRTYGGKLLENIVQGMAADVLAEGMLNAESMGMETVLTVYDEITAEVAGWENDPHKMLIECMTAPISWCPDLPLAAKGFTTDRYRKD